MAPKYVVLQECLPFTIDECEREWIARGKRKGWKLCNIAEGGGSGQFSDATKAVLRGISRGRWSDPDYQRRHEASRARRAGLSVGEYRERIEERLRQRKGNLDRWRQNMAIAAERAEKKRERFVFVRITHGDVAFVPLSRGAWAAIDAEDWCRIAQWKWHLQIKGRYKRAKRTVNKHGEIELLNRRVTNAGDHQYVMHRNGNQLDCRKQNLHVRTYANGRGVSRDETEPYDT